MVDFTQLIGRGNFYFLRHGESAGNAAHIAQGQADFPLTEKGKMQAVQVGRWLADKDIHLILSSPLLRASETAEIIAQEIGIAVHIREELIEVDIGPFSGLTWTESAARYPEMQRQFYMRSWDGVPGAEKSDALYGRAEAVWKLVLDFFQDGQQNILIVTHSGLLQWIIKVTLGSKTWLPLFRMRNCSNYHFILHNRLVPPDAAVNEETPAYHYLWDIVNLQD